MDRGSVALKSHTTPDGAVSYLSGEGDQSPDVFASVVRNRRGWKSFKNGEPVWPPELESALIEGLELYVPSNHRETKHLGRFPLRNRFISDYIYRKTGTRRTPKQVGSRIQQMRDTCAGKELRKLLRPYVPPRRISAQSESSIRTIPDPQICNTGLSIPENNDDCVNDMALNSSPARESTPVNADLLNVIYIDIVPPWNNVSSLDGLGMTEGWSPMINDTGCVNYIQISHQPRPLHSISQTVSFVSGFAISAHVIFNVRMNDTPVFTERTALTAAGRLSDGNGDACGAYLYWTTLVPGYWEKICNNSNPTQFIIEQEVRMDSASASEPPLFFAIYKLRYPTKPPCVGGTTQPSDHGPLSTGVVDSYGSEDQLSFDVTTDYSKPPEHSFEELSQFLHLGDDALLTELESVRMQNFGVSVEPPYYGSVSAPEFLSPSRRQSMSPFSSETSSESGSISYMSSPTSCPETTLELGLHVGQDALAERTRSFVSYFQEDLFNGYDM